VYDSVANLILHLCRNVNQWILAIDGKQDTRSRDEEFAAHSCRTEVTSVARHPLKGKHIVITGASDGIGRALAIEIAHCGGRVSLAARSRQMLDEVAAEIQKIGGTATVIPTDVSVESDCRALIDQSITAQGDIDVLVCNAGIGWEARRDAPNWPAVVKRTMDVNFMGAVYPVDAALQSLRRTNGIVVAVSSVQGLIPFPYSSGYSASKHAMQGYFDCLRLELKGAVDILVVSPGPVATKIHFAHNTSSRVLTKQQVEARTMPVGTCARIIRQAIEKGRREVVMTLPLNLATKLYRFVPDLVDRWIIRATQSFYAQ
jgi:short-subunit dehydrogenase